VAKVLAGTLEANMVFAPAHFELTKGTDDDLAFGGQNRESLQGNAVLSRYPILDARVIRLPVCFEPFGFEEKRYGGRNCIWAKLQIGGRILWVGSIHLEVRNTPRCRKIQMQHVLENLPGTAADCYLLGGDFNSNSFSRGTLWRTCASIWKLIARPPSQLAQELRHPERGSEPLFQAAAKAGFSWQGLNSDEDTACAPINALEDARLVPECVIQSVKRRISALEGYLSFELDWLMGKGLRSLRTGDVVDYATGISSLDPGCVRTERRGIHRISDHAPIHADIALPAGFMPQ
jgi:endonuclease/exonuclease/phosphatase family metal-dependent hydrolase